MRLAPSIFKSRSISQRRTHEVNAMNRSNLQSTFAALLCLTLPSLAWANLTNTATATYKDAAGNSYSATSNTVTVKRTVTPAAVITLTKTANPTSATSGTNVTFTIQYQNTTAGPASNVVITDVVPT